MEIEIEDIYREVAPKLMRYLTGNGCSYAMACDVVQETFLRLLNLKVPIRGDMREASGLVFTIARNYRNDLARKARHEQVGGASRDDDPDVALTRSADAVRPGEDEEEIVLLRQRLRATLGRMPVRLLETFALSRLGSLTVKEIAGGTGVSESNVKVRVHRARELFRTCLDAFAPDVPRGESGVGELALLKAMMMLAAVDGEIAKEELSLYQGVAARIRNRDPSGFDFRWEDSVRSMAYVGFLTSVLPPEKIVREYVREVREALGSVRSMPLERRKKFISRLERLAVADGVYSLVERDCVRALAKEMGKA